MIPGNPIFGLSETNWHELILFKVCPFEPCSNLWRYHRPELIHGTEMAIV